MRKFFFAIFAFFITTNVLALTVTCKNKADTNCTTNERLNPPADCNKISKTDISTDYLYLTGKQLDGCSSQIKKFFNNTKCPAVQRAFLGKRDYLLYCITNKNITLKYTNEETDNWSYAHKRCVGSHGKWTDSETCDCSELPGTESINNECICTQNKNQKYYNKMLSGCATLANGVTYANSTTQIYGFDFDLANRSKSQSCPPSGGDWDDKKNSCNCDSKTLNFELDESGYFCNCKSGYDYINPLAKSNGCVPISDIPGYDTTSNASSSSKTTKKTATPKSESQTDKLKTQGYCLDKEGNTGSSDDAEKTFCWCDSSMGNRCRLSNLLLEGQQGVCTGNNKKQKCNEFCSSKAQEILNICECLEKDSTKTLQECTLSQNTTDDPKLANDCTNTKWRDANCEKSDDIYDGDGLFYCPFIIKKGDKTQEQNFDKQGCQGFASNTHCWMHEVDSIYKRFCFDEANNKVVVVDHIACPGTDNAEAVVAYIDNTYQLSEDEYGTCVELINEEEEENITNPNDQDVRQENDGKQTLEEETDTDRSQELEEKLKSAKDALAAAKEKENSWANRALGAASTAATSLGAMQLAEGIAERKADTDAETQMRNYISTMKCEYGNGQGAVLGNEEITLPGGNELLEYYTEYKTLADNLKTTKAALGLRAGIESETLYDRAQSGLYQYASTGKTGGGETSLFRALTDAESEDAAAWADQKETASKKLKAGTAATVVGVGGGIVGNYLVNGRDKKDEKKD